MIPPLGLPGWFGEAKGRGKGRSLDPDDPISQVPRAINGHSLVSAILIRCCIMPYLLSRSSGLQSVHEETLLPPHVFAPMSPQQSVRSPEGKYSGEPIPEPNNQHLAM